MGSRPWADWLWPLALALPWVINPGFGPSPQVLQACLAGCVAIAWWAMAPRDTPTQALGLAGGLLAGALANAVIALIQWFGGVPDGGIWISAAKAGEAMGNLRQRNQLASLMAMGLCAAFYLLHVGRPGPRARWLLAAGVGLLATASTLTASRVGALQWLAVCLLSAWALRRPTGQAPGALRARWPWAALATYGLVALLAPSLLAWTAGTEASNVFDRLATDRGCYSRQVLWHNALYLIAQHPWAGWGAGQMDWAHYATLYPMERFCLIVDNAHNLFLQIGVEFGVPAAVALAAVLAWAVLRLRPWREREPARLLAWALLAIVLLHSLVEYPLWYGPFQLAVLLAIGLLWRGQLPARLRTALCALCAAALAYVAWDYLRVSQLFIGSSDRVPFWQADPLASARASVMFRGQVAFAEFSITPLTQANAAELARLGDEALRYSPEPRVIRKQIEALALLGRWDDAAWHMARFRAAFPEDYRRWSDAERPRQTP